MNSVVSKTLVDTAIVTMDDDLQNPPEEIPRLLGAIQYGRLDLVYGECLLKEHELAQPEFLARQRVFQERIALLSAGNVVPDYAWSASGQPL